MYGINSELTNTTHQTPATKSHTHSFSHAHTQLHTHTRTNSRSNVNHVIHHCVASICKFMNVYAYTYWEWGVSSRWHCNTTDGVLICSSFFCLYLRQTLTHTCTAFVCVCGGVIPLWQRRRHSLLLCIDTTTTIRTHEHTHTRTHSHAQHSLKRTHILTHTRTHNRKHIRNCKCEYHKVVY